MEKGHNHKPIRAGYAAIFIVCILIAVKSFAYYESNATSILSSLTDSVLDAAVSLMALGSLYYARRPADADHRWGHGKMEAVSALFQAAIIIGGGAFLLFESISRFFHPVPVTHHMTGIYVIGFSIVLSIVLVMIQRHALRQSESLAIEADSVHYGSDIMINLGVVIVLVLSAYGAPFWIDPLFAIFVAGFMAYLAWGIALKSLNMLLDRELQDGERAKIITIIESHEGVLGWHDLRTHRNGPDYVVSFDVEVDADLSLLSAHDIAKDLEAGILMLYPRADILIHIDPKGYIEDARHRVRGVHI